MRVATNANGVELHYNKGWHSILKPKGDGTNRVFHVGKPAYIRKIWQNQYQRAKKYQNPFERA